MFEGVSPSWGIVKGFPLNSREDRKSEIVIRSFGSPKTLPIFGGSCEMGERGARGDGGNFETCFKIWVPSLMVGCFGASYFPTGNHYSTKIPSWEQKKNGSAIML